MKQTNNDQISVGTGTLSIFVYGTLKRGYWNHDRFCQTALSIEEAVVQGRLYELPSRIPVLQVPDSCIIAVGTSDPLADVATQERFSDRTSDAICEKASWQMIYGELVTFPDPCQSLPKIDQLEGFRLGQSCIYRRVLVPVMTSGSVVQSAWCYIDGGSLIRKARPTNKISWS
ncbi:gamma-glutamylcyclotransferase [bacterium]|nr:gamma-glutamylcyclotransferase [bacterium]